MNTETTRERTYTWHNPLHGAAKAKQMSGIEYLQAMGEGRLPTSPVLQTLDIVPAHIEQGNVDFAFTPQEFHYNPIGSVHGGVITAVLDSAMGCSLHSLLPAGTGYTTLELKVNFLKAVTIQSGWLIGKGKVIYKGGRTALTEAQLVDEKGIVYAHAVSTCLIMEGKKEG